MDTVALVTIAIFLAGVIFDSGQKSARLNALEQWRAELRSDISSIQSDLKILLERANRHRSADHE